jgi:hypothetical protein
MLFTHTWYIDAIDPDMEGFLEGRLEASTRRNYESGLRSVARLLESHGLGLNADSTICIPMSLNVWSIWLKEAAKPLDATGRLRIASTVFGYINAVKFAHSEKNIKLSQSVEMLIKKYIESYKRRITKLRMTGVMSSQEGKLHFSLNLYSKLCKLAMFSSENGSRFVRFVHCYMVMCWNLFQRYAF